MRHFSMVTAASNRADGDDTPGQEPAHTTAEQAVCWPSGLSDRRPLWDTCGVMGRFRLVASPAGSDDVRSSARVRR